ncbi:HAMP domain-containing histidine kinase [Clostridium sp. MD294]|uniref:HAMP domain-containing histidine kinase n=1 Tax=Clostridium sp. MD294 TaxID=97138 RepID=UPI0002C922B0|nr:HAMP domain-containing histidine kinase [Clostridium sp. MD294]NDO45722.1 HAMP domain-containing histidine kinase [Clostridium sp. MD294]USF30623.1 Alkaline phosphatase synthesis sensor protein PhoR [Clostridium sp. MD294]
MQRKVFCSYIFVICFIVGLIGFYSIKISYDYYIQEFQSHILKEGNIISKHLNVIYSTKNFMELNNFIKQTANDLDVDITMIDKNGNIISTSETNLHNVNLKNMPEVQGALRGEILKIIRKNEVYNKNYFYIAIPTTLNSERIVLRFCVPLLKLNELMTNMIINVTVSTIFAFICAYYLSKKISEPLDTLINTAMKVSQGKYNKNISVTINDQIGFLTETFNMMSIKLNTTINALETENKKMEAIVNSMINGVIAIDKKNKILMINSQCYELFDIKNTYCKGLDFYEICDNKDIQMLLETSISEKRNIVEIVILKSNFNGDKILRIYINPIFTTKNQNNSLGTLLVFQDVTQIKKLEEMRSNFISNVTHELKTPLTSIMGFTDTLRSGAINNQDMAIHFLEIIDIETHRLYRLIQDILSLSEIETRKEDTNMQYESIEKILTYVEGLLRPQAEEKGLKLTIECEAMPFYFCNKDKISQMFINLIENAIKYTEKGSVMVFCKFQGEYFVLQVKDTGIGIAEESIDRIFERFYRVDKSRSRKAGGTGLGLSIVKHIMMLYNGKVKVESKEGEGTTFTISMPYERETKNK